jgi:hypothetical protein
LIIREKNNDFGNMNISTYENRNMLESTRTALLWMSGQDVLL